MRRSARTDVLLVWSRAVDDRARTVAERGDETPLPDGSPQRPEAVRVRYHVIPALVVLAMVAAFTVGSVVVFSLVFLLDDEFDGWAVLAGLAKGTGVAVGASAACVVLGIGLDWLTRAVPAYIRWAAPVPLPLIGIVMVVIDVNSVGWYVAVLGVVFCAYWAVFLAQAVVERVVRWAWGRVRSRPRRSNLT